MYSCATTKKHTPTNALAQHTNKELNDLFFDGEKARLLGDTKNAINKYKEYISYTTDNATVYFNLARLEQKTNNYASAENNFKKAYQLEPNNKFITESYADILNYNNHKVQALSIYNGLLQKYPKDEDYYYKKANIQLANGSINDAIETLNLLEKNVGGNEELTLQKKDLYIKTGNTEKALNELLKLKKENPLESKYLIFIAELYDKLNMEGKADTTYQEVEKQFSTDPTAIVTLAKYYHDKKDTKKHYYYLDKIVQSKDIDLDTKMALVLPLIQKINTDTNSTEQTQAIQMLQNMYQTNPTNKEIIALYADVLYYTKKETEAIPLYYKAIQMDASKSSYWTQIANIYTTQQKYDSVIFVSNKGLALFPNNGLLFFFKGLAYSQQKNNTKSITSYVQAIQCTSENKDLNAQCYSSLADVYNTEKQYDKSDSCFKKSLALVPNDASTLNNYAYYLSLRSYQLEEAATMSKKSLEISPNQKSFLDTYGWILFKQKKYTEAKEYILQAIQANGENDGTLNEHLGDVYYFLNDREKAIEQWNIATKKGEKNSTLLKKINDKKYYEQ